jgi:hypothetical protein
MAWLILLDAGPLGVACNDPLKPQGQKVGAWVQTVLAAGGRIIVPAIADYEVRRELVRIGAVNSVHRLDVLEARLGYLPITRAALVRAAELWALVRQAGQPTAHPQALDADASLAGQAATAGQAGDTVTIATTNVGHLARFPSIDARDWTAIP